MFVEGNKSVAKLERTRNEKRVAESYHGSGLNN